MARDILMAVNVVLVIVIDMVCCFCSTFIAGFLAAFLAAFLGESSLIPLTGLLSISSVIGVGHLAGRWIARRPMPPTATEVIVGCVIYTSASTAVAALAHPGVAVVTLIANSAISLVLFRSAQNKDLGVAAIMNKVWKTWLVVRGPETSTTARK